MSFVESVFQGVGDLLTGGGRSDSGLVRAVEKQLAELARAKKERKAKEEAERQKVIKQKENAALRAREGSRNANARRARLNPTAALAPTTTTKKTILGG